MEEQGLGKLQQRSLKQMGLMAEWGDGGRGLSLREIVYRLELVPSLPNVMILSGAKRLLGD